MSNETLTIEKISELQKQYGLTTWQERINSGTAWHLEGWYGRRAMEMLESGACVLPEVPRKDYWGNIVPSRTTVKEGTTGSLENCQTFWQNVLDGDITIVSEEEEEE